MRKIARLSKIVWALKSISGTQISFICRRFQIRSADGLLMSFSNNCSIFAQETNKQQQTLYSLLYSLYTFKYGEKELN